MPVNKRLFLFAYNQQPCIISRIYYKLSIAILKYHYSVGEVAAGGPAVAPAAAAEAPVAQWLPRKRRSRNGNGNKAYTSVRFVVTRMLHKNIGLRLAMLKYVRGTST
jgi:hypothetical protein